MSLSEVVRTSLGEIRHHKMRSSLTLLGIILGTLSITFMTSLLDGIVTAVWDGFSDLGFDGVMFVMQRDPRDLTEQAIFTRSKGLQPIDAEVVLSRGQLVSAVAPIIYWEELVRRGNVERKARVLGVTASYNEVRSRRVAEGRFINEYDDRTFARVCVVGHYLRKRLFGNEDPVGKSIQVAGRACRVVGVGEKLGNQFFDDDDMTEEMEGLYLPLSTLRKFYTGEDQPLTVLAVKTGSVERLGAMKAEVISSLKIAHRGAQDFRVENIAEEILRARTEVGDVLKSWKIVLGSIAGISLLVGGIGLLSVMLIAIGERLYEIGLRKAIGASDFEIFMQFLLEAVVLSLIGASIGAGLGVGFIKSVQGFFTWELPINLAGLSMAMGIAILLGLVFGVYPALKASRMAPVDALRSAA